MFPSSLNHYIQYPISISGTPCNQHHHTIFVLKINLGKPPEAEALAQILPLKQLGLLLGSKFKYKNIWNLILKKMVFLVQSRNKCKTKKKKKKSSLKRDCDFSKTQKILRTRTNHLGLARQCGSRRKSDEVVWQQMLVQ